MAFCILSGS